MSVVIRVIEVVGTPFCVATEDGTKLYQAIFEYLSRRSPVEVSFRGVTRLTTAFLNAAIGQAYGEFTEDDIRHFLQVSGLDERGLSLLTKVVDRAKIFFGHQRRA